LDHELGIKADDVPVTPETFKYLTRILYKAPSNDQWGEHEGTPFVPATFSFTQLTPLRFCLLPLVDYIFFLQPPTAPTVVPNDGEVKAIKYVTIDELKQLLEDAKEKRTLVTPWFRMICERFLFGWWQTLMASPAKLPVNDNEIHKVS
jgi:isopentenyl-diphosphate delta-isomerase